MEAINLAEQIACYPRTLVDSRCIEMAMNDINRPDDTSAAFPIRDSDYLHLLLRDGDEVILNYLAVLLLGAYDEWRIDLALDLHRAHIKDNLARFECDEKLMAKYRWAADYHDFFVTQVAWLPQYLIGSRQDRHFASFSLSWLPGSSSVAEDTLGQFEHLCAKADVAQLVSSPEQETVDAAGPESIHAIAASITHNCDALISQEEGMSSSDGTSDIQQVVMNVSRVVNAATDAAQTLADIDKIVVYEALLVLDKGLRILRVDRQVDTITFRGLSMCAERLGINLDWP